MFRTTLSRLTTNMPSIFYALKKADLALHHYLRRQFEPDFLRFAGIARAFPNLSIIDVGANIGQSAIGFAQLFPRARIHSFEANPDLEDYLSFCRSMIGERFQYHMIGLSEHPGEVTLYIPRRGEVLILGEASVDRGALDDPAVEHRIGPFEITQRSVRLVPFDTLELHPDLVKIDVQGHELSVLHGMSAAISRSAPLFLIERSAADAAIRDLLTPMGYSFYLPSPANASLVPYDGGSNTVNMFCVPTGVPTRAPLVKALLG